MIFWIFLFLMIMHMLADFGTPYRQWGKGRKQFFVSEYFLTLNPLHFIWDEWSPLRRHPLYAITHNKPTKTYNFDGTYNLDDNKRIVTTEVSFWFWRWLAVDQIFHVLANAFLAWIVVSL